MAHQEWVEWTTRNSKLDNRNSKVEYREAPQWGFLFSLNDISLRAMTQEQLKTMRDRLVVLRRFL